jgi:hypothetical protein
MAQPYHVIDPRKSENNNFDEKNSATILDEESAFLS